MPGDISRENGRKGGRKKGTSAIQAEKYREFLIAEMLKEKKPLVQALIAKGLSGDVPALKELHDRALGKPLQAIDHTTKGDKLPTPILADVPRNDGD